MSWVIEFRNGTYMQLSGDDGGALATAMRFGSKEEVDGFMREREWVAINGGMAKEEGRLSGSLLPTQHTPITGDFNDPNASGALCYLFAHIGGILLGTIGEKQLRGEFETLLAQAPRVIKVKP